MNFLKRNFGEIARLFIYQLGISVFALVLYTSMSSLSDIGEDSAYILKISFSALSIFFYQALIFCAMRALAIRDRAEIDSGNEPCFKSKGLFISLAANMPSLLVSVSAVVFILIYAFYGLYAFLKMFTAATLIMRFLSSMYIGAAVAFCPPFDISDPYSFLPQTLFFVIAPILTVLICNFSYRLGLKTK